MLDRRLLLPVAVRHYVADSASATATPDTHPTETRDPVSERDEPSQHCVITVFTPVCLSTKLGLTEEGVSKIYSAPNTETKEIFPRGLPKNFRTQVREMHMRTYTRGHGGGHGGHRDTIISIGTRSSA